MWTWVDDLKEILVMFVFVPAIFLFVVASLITGLFFSIWLVAFAFDLVWGTDLSVHMANLMPGRWFD